MLIFTHKLILTQASSQKTVAPGSFHWPFSDSSNSVLRKLKETLENHPCLYSLMRLLHLAAQGHCIERNDATESKTRFSKPLAFFWLLCPNRTVTAAMISGVVQDIILSIPECEEEVQTDDCSSHPRQEVQVHHVICP
jgi:hypothetical protein